MSDKTASYYLALNIYRRLTGDNTTQFDTVDDIWTAIDTDITGNEGVINIEELDVKYTSNGEYVYESTDDITAYAPVKVTVDMPTGFSFSEIGYTDEDTTNCNDAILNQIQYSKTIQDSYDPNVLWNTSSAFFHDMPIVIAPMLDTSKQTFFGTDTYTGAVSSKYGMFEGCTPLLYVPKYDTSNGKYFYRMFYNCKALQELPLFDLSNALNLNSTFYGCKSLKTIPHFNTSKVISMYYTFLECSSLETVPLLDTSNVKYMQGMFRECSSIVNIPHFNTSNVTEMQYMFYECNNLMNVPTFDTSSVTNFSYMFYRCPKLVTAPAFDTSSATNFSYMFYNCSSLTRIPEYDTSKATTISNIFDLCTGLISVPELDCSKVKTATNIFGNYYTLTKLTDLGGFTNLGMESSFSGTSYYFINLLKNVTHNSLMNVINKLYDRKSAGYSVVTLNFGTNNLNKLTDEEKAIATNKGWTLS